MPFSATACEILCALSTNTIQRVKHDVQMIWWRSLAGQRILHYTNWTCISFGFFWCASVGVSGYSGCKVLLQFSCASFILRRHGKCIAAYPLANSDFLHGGFLKWGAPKSSRKNIELSIINHPFKPSILRYPHVWKSPHGFIDLRCRNLVAARPTDHLNLSESF